MSKNPVRVIAGLRGARNKMQRLVDANKKDIANGHDFHHMLKENTVKLLAAEARLQNYQRGLVK